MKKFIDFYNKILLEQEQQVQQNVQQQQNTVNASQPQQSETEPTEITDETKVYLISLILKALAVDPSTIPDQEKGIFNAKVTAENADKILEQLMSYIP